ncbi:hypothetical protein D3C72_1060740 [compost metagenome]
MLLLGQAATLDERQRQRNEAGHEDGVQDENADVQAQKVRMAQGRADGLARHTRLTVLQDAVGIGHHKGDQQDADQGKSCRGEEQS